jgi:hypothetical protein
LAASAGLLLASTVLAAPAVAGKGPLGGLLAKAEELGRMAGEDPMGLAQKASDRGWVRAQQDETLSLACQLSERARVGGASELRARGLCPEADRAGVAAAAAPGPLPAECAAPKAPGLPPAVQGLVDGLQGVLGWVLGVLAGQAAPSAG